MSFFKDIAVNSTSIICVILDMLRNLSSLRGGHSGYTTVITKTRRNNYSTRVQFLQLEQVQMILHCAAMITELCGIYHTKD